MFLPHTYQTRDFAPALAARLERPLVTDVVALTRQDDGLVYTRPVFQGKLNADVAATGPAPHLVTFQIGAFRGDAAAKGAAPAPVRALSVVVDDAAIRQKPEAPFKEAKQAVDLSQAERIVAVGRGIKGQEHIAHGQVAGGGAGRRARCLTADLRCRLAADGSPDRQLRPDRGAEASTSRSGSPAPSSISSA